MSYTAKSTKRTIIAVAGLAIAGVMMATAARASTIELRFTETQMPLATISGQVLLTPTDYNAFGISTTNAYRYIDSRDPFSDGAENFSGTSPFGLSACFRGLCEVDTNAGNPARIDFLSPVTWLSIDWWTISSNTIYIDVFDSGGANIHSLSGIGSGTESIMMSDIGALTWHDSGGLVQISNIRWHTPIPEPGTLAIFGLGLAGLGFARRKKAA